jgi:hypothetical protein
VSIRRICSTSRFGILRQPLLKAFETPPAGDAVVTREGHTRRERDHRLRLTAAYSSQLVGEKEKPICFRRSVSASTQRAMSDRIVYFFGACATFSCAFLARRALNLPSAAP